MPPKKKSKKTKKTPEKSANGNGLEEKYRHGALDVAILEDYIAFQCESVRKVQSDRSDLRRRVRDLEQRLQHQRQDLLDISADLRRQSSNMKEDLALKVRTLEEEVMDLREKLASCQEELRTEKKERERLEREKDVAVKDLQHKLDDLESDCEKVLHVSRGKTPTQNGSDVQFVLKERLVTGLTVRSDASRLHSSALTGTEQTNQQPLLATLVTFNTSHVHADLPGVFLLPDDVLPQITHV